MATAKEFTGTREFVQGVHGVRYQDDGAGSELQGLGFLGGGVAGGDAG